MTSLCSPAPSRQDAPLAVPTPADTATGDYLAFLADGGDPDAYTGPEWAGDTYEPTPAESAEWDTLSERDAIMRAYFEEPDHAHALEQWEQEQRNREARGWPFTPVPDWPLSYA